MTMTDHSIISLCLLIYASSVLDLSKSELRKLIPTCSNSCLGTSTTMNCFCDNSCVLYRDCCIDALYRTFGVNSKLPHKSHCVYVNGENAHYWMVDTCKPSWSGHDHIREKCIQTTEVRADTNDIIGVTPVTSVKDKATYKNYYCALCNNANAEDLIEWTVKAICSNDLVSQDDILTNLTFVEETRQWGVYKQSDQNVSEVFYECQLMFEVPSNVSIGVRRCVAGLVATCPKSWKNIATRRKCKSYVDPVKWSTGPIYANIDCAACHNRTAENYQCLPGLSSESNRVMLSRGMSVDFGSMGQWL